MKILFEENNASKRAGGVEAATAGLGAALARQDVQVFRCLPEASASVVENPDCVHIHGIWSLTLARRSSYWRRQGIPVVVTVHGMLEPWSLAHKRLKKLIGWHIYQKRLLNRVSALHATSEREAKNLKRLGLKVPIVMAPWGVDTQAKVEIDESGVSTVSGNERTALFVGRIASVKGLPMLVEAWAKVRPAGWKMKIVGPDEAGHLAEVKSLVREAGLEADFEFTGALVGVELAKAYETADLFVLPSHTENFGMVVAEAMTHELPVITTHGTPWKLLEEENCGWWVPVSADGIAIALGEAIGRRSDQLSAMGKDGRKIVEARFAWKGVAEQFIECYLWLQGEGENPEFVV